MQIEAGLLAVLALAVLAFMYRRRRASVRRMRGQVFDACLPLFDSYRVTQDDLSFAVLDGDYRGHEVRLEPVSDDLAVRKVPSLWLLVTVQGRVPFAGSFDLLIRPQNTEFYSPSEDWSDTVRLPAGWPEHARIRTDRPEAMPPLELLARHIGVFADPRAKEMVVTPHGVRLVYQADQANRSYYLVLRQSEFSNLAFSAHMVRNLLDRAVALFDDLVAAGPGLATQAKRLEQGVELASQ